MTLRPALSFITRKTKLIPSLDLLVRYNPGVRRQVADAIAQCRQASPGQRRGVADQLTAAVLRRARQTRYGRPFGDRLAGWPVLTKPQLRDDPLAFVTPGFLRVPASTSGTTGTPLSLHRSLRSIAAERAFLDDLLAPFGLRWDTARLAIMRGEASKDPDDLRPPFGKRTHGGRHLLLSSPHLKAASLGWFVTEITAFRPDLLYSSPTILADLLALLAQSGHRLRLPLVVSSSERLDAGLFRALQRDLGATVIDYYGLSERSVLAVRQAAEEWRFQPAYGRVELIPGAGDEIAGGRRLVPIVATGYWNDAQPLIRYETGDHAIVPANADAAALEAIALGEAPFFGIAGRGNEFILAPDGRRIGALDLLAREQPHALRLQVVQDVPDRVVIRVLATPAFDAADRSRLLANAAALIPKSMAVAIECVTRLETTARGKSPFVIRRVGADPDQ